MTDRRCIPPAAQVVVCCSTIIHEFEKRERARDAEALNEALEKKVRTTWDSTPPIPWGPNPHTPHWTQPSEQSDVLTHGSQVLAMLVVNTRRSDVVAPR
jgi:hypothetical protein